MLKLAELNSASAAQTFADYCVGKGWHVSVVVQNPQRAEIFTAPDCIEQVQQELELFLQNPEQQKYSQAAWSRNQPAVAGQSLGLGDIWQRMRLMSGLVTQAIALCCVLVFVAQQIWPLPLYQTLTFFHNSSELQQWLSWRWLTPALLHFSAAHLIFNLLAWWLFAGRIERQLGGFVLLWLSLVAAVLSNTAQFLFKDANFGGLSGVVYAVIGFVWVYGWRFKQQPLRLGRADIGMALLFLLLGFADMLWVNTANWAHLFGLGSGMLLALAQSGPATQSHKAA
ncbi:MAG TPA: rhomboid family intramembrane serine protease GlpG [Rheinheimera sp.]|uniref:rhomboid family intramembrane serine protease GlpG n=1 Tax=Rheinheimera sp. TaxID=1869214 RepID=UPI000EBF1A04|nr:rhomboid family intramembrane serine protease GlpG [Rheinheimera sp.]HCU65672.1 rhomboid family intramembrane serine protease GlpG [Rheinheimera sp.]